MSIRILVVAALFLWGVAASPAAGQMMTGGIAGDDHTAREEAEGKAIWEKLQSKQVACAGLRDGDFGALGEYFMGQMLGDAHPAMNAMMERMMGKEGEEQVHVVMGKRLSGCDADAAFPSGGLGFMPMMQMMWGGWPARQSLGDGGSAPRGGNTVGPMMWNGFDGMMDYGWGGFGLVFWITTLLVWAVLVLLIVALWRRISQKP